MDSKNYTQVLIDGKIYTLGGSEDEGYLQKTASYVNEKNNVLRKLPGFSKQSVEYRTAMVELNLADDYFKAMDHSTEVERQRDDMEREMYSLKHELVSTQMKLEVVLKDLEERQRELEELTREKNRLDRKVKSMEKAQSEAAASAGTCETPSVRTGGGSYRVKRAARPMLVGRKSGPGSDNQAGSEEPEPASKERADKKEPGQVAVTVEFETEVTEVEVTEVLTQAATGEGREGVAAEESREAVSTENVRESVSTENGRESVAVEEGREVAATENGRADAAVEEGRESAAVEEGWEAMPTENGRESAAAKEGREAAAAEEGREAAAAEEGRESDAAEEGRESAAVEEGREAAAVAEGQEASENIAPESAAAENDISETQTVRKEATTRESNRQLTQKALHAAMAARKKKKR